MAVLEGRVAIVTGAGRGIGRGTAFALAKEGSALVLVDLDEETVSATGEDLRGLGAEVETLVGDVGSQALVDETVARAKDTFGRVDVLVNNAQAVTPGLLFEEHEDSDLEMNLGTGLWGTFRFMRACFPEMRERGGRIVNIASAAGTHGMAGFAAYAAAKEGIRGLTKVAATEWGPYGINVNAICPQAATEKALAYYESRPGLHQEQIEKRAIRRDGDPEGDIGRTIVFLAGPDSGFITGATIMVNGGANIMP